MFPTTSQSIRRESERGFTLVETLVAITILIFVIIGPMTIATKGMRMAYFADEQITAVFLAQEAIESFERLRDNSALDTLYGSETDTWAWFDTPPGSGEGSGIGNCTGASTCDIDITTGTYHECVDSGTPESDTCRLYYDSGATNGFVYSYDDTNGTLSPYKREIYLAEDGAGNVQVTVTVRWNAHLFDADEQSAELQTWLFDHYNRFE